MARRNSSPMISHINRAANSIIGARSYPLAFATVFSLAVVFNFYPAILFSDSYARWIAAEHLANAGLAAFSEIDSRSPLIPLFAMAGAIRLTGEIGFFHWAQAFVFSLTLFRFSNYFSRTWLSNLVTSALLLLPISVVYSVFSSYDVIFAIALLNACLFLLKTRKTSCDALWLALCFAVAVGTRFPAIVLLPILLYALTRLRHTFVNPLAFRIAIGTVAVLSMVVAAMPFLLSQKQPAQSRSIAMNASPFFDGIAWEYQNYATKSSSTREAAFLQSIGLEKEKLAREISYRSVWANDSAGFRFMQKIPYSMRWQLLQNYCQFAVSEPYLFMTEKLKYLSDLLGFRGPIANAEIGKWRSQYDGSNNWEKKFARFGFYTNQRKDFLIDAYFSFMRGPGMLFLFPFAVMAIIVMAVPPLYRVNKAIVYCVALFFLYYCTYWLNGASHELRYFFPVIYFMMACVPPALSLVVGVRLDPPKSEVWTQQAGRNEHVSAKKIWP